LKRDKGIWVTGAEAFPEWAACAEKDVYWGMQDLQAAVFASAMLQKARMAAAMVGVNFILQWKFGGGTGDRGRVLEISRSALRSV